ncbi:hypothetical protein [Acetivibrio saccincola]|jgi:WD40 repeat protein|nr:hypothetical protein [Acetivibrio saccincola]
MYSMDGKRILSTSWGKSITEWDVLTGECIRSIINTSGLMIRGCSFKALHKDSDMSQQCMEIMEMYGVEEINIEENSVENDNSK